MKFRYYITDLFEGEVRGTNDKEVAEQFAPCDDYFVVDALTGEWITGDGDRTDVKEMKNESV